jgi:putative tricarboxylic transport membrane protein
MDALIAALATTFQPWSLVFILTGTLVGVGVGAVPGLTGAMVIALTLPMTFYMESTHALILLVSMYVGAISGSLITATLLKIPGTPASIMTTFDGYPLAMSGHAGRALGLGIYASLGGGLVSWLVLATLSPPLASFALRFGPFEIFALTLTALVLIVSVTEGAFLKGLISGLLGVLAALPGLDPVSGQLRLTFGWRGLTAGFELLPVLIGVFAVSQILIDLVAPAAQKGPARFTIRSLFLRRADLARHGVNALRSSVIGTWIGILPGVGANVGSLMAYTVAKNLSRAPERFGHGSEEGIVASESANNATVGGALIPLLTLGIPGSVVDAILIGAFMIHNLQPGPLLFNSHPVLVWSIIVATLISNLMMFAIMIVGTKLLIRLVEVPKAILNPILLVFCFLGSFAAGNSFHGVWVMILFGLVGFCLQWCRVPLGPFVIGLVLTPIAEKSFRSALMHSDGSLLPFVTRPIALVFVLVSLVSLAYALYRELRPSASVPAP